MNHFFKILLTITICSNFVFAKGFKLINPLDFESRSNNSSNPCLIWKGLLNKTPKIQYDSQGTPHFKVRVLFERINDCRVRFSPKQWIIKEGRNYIDLIIYPSLMVIQVRGKDYSDRIFIESSVLGPDGKLFSITEKIKNKTVVVRKETRSVFEPFKKFTFDLNLIYGNLSTNNPDMDPVISDLPKETALFPIVEAKLGIPNVFLKNLNFDFSFSKSITQLAHNEKLDIDYSEFIFDFNYNFILSSLSGKPSIAPSVLMRGRNLLQPNGKSVFLSRSILSPGFGAKIKTQIPFGKRSSNKNYMSSLYADAHYYPEKVDNGIPHTAISYSAGANFHIWNKWALSIFYSYLSEDILKTTVAATTAVENTSKIGVGLIFRPDH